MKHFTATLTDETRLMIAEIATKQRIIAWLEANRDRVNAWSRKSYQNNHENHRALCVRWDNENREKRRVHLRVGRAIKAGTLERGKCEVCSSSMVDAHHDDYTRPLEVRWLCRAHHRRLHMERT